MMTASERPLTERQEAILLAMLKHERQADAVAASYGMTANDIGYQLGLPAVQGGRGGGWPWARSSDVRAGAACDPFAERAGDAEAGGEREAA